MYRAVLFCHLLWDCKISEGPEIFMAQLYTWVMRSLDTTWRHILILSLYYRRSAVAIQVWQPQAVRARQQELLEQQSVNAGARQRALQMEINVCRDRVQQFEKSLVSTMSIKTYTGSYSLSLACINHWVHWYLLLPHRIFLVVGLWRFSELEYPESRDCTAQPPALYSQKHMSWQQAKRSAIEKSSRELEALTFNPSRNLHDSLTADERADRKAALKRKRDTSSSSSQTPQTE